MTGTRASRGRRPRRQPGRHAATGALPVLEDPGEPEIPDGEEWDAGTLRALRDDPAPDPREEAARVLTSPEPPTRTDLHRIAAGLRALDAWRPETAQETGRVPEPEAAPEPEIPRPEAPADVRLLALGGEGRGAHAALTGMPARRTVNGYPVIHLGDDPQHPGEAFALAGMSDQWLAALALAVDSERDDREEAGRRLRSAGTGEGS